jgi:two-component system, LytTR family, response regulator
VDEGGHLDRADRVTALRAYVVDDEPLALRRLARMLDATRRVEIVGQSTDPECAVEEIRRAGPDVLFLDIEMPRLTGFELLGRLDVQPLIVFTTAFDEYAIRAFEVNSIDYLLKPIDPERLDQALDKAERFRGHAWPPDLRRVVDDLARAARPRDRLTRLPSRIGDRTQFIDLAQVTHVYARDKLTYASTPSRDAIVDFTIGDLERRLEPEGFLRIHRAALVNLRYVQELQATGAGGAVVRLNDAKKTELPVSRDRIRALRERLGI